MFFLLISHVVIMEYGFVRSVQVSQLLRRCGVVIMHPINASYAQKGILHLDFQVYKCTYIGHTINNLKRFVEGIATFLSYLTLLSLRQILPNSFYDCHLTALGKNLCQYLFCCLHHVSEIGLGFKDLIVVLKHYAISPL